MKGHKDNILKMFENILKNILEFPPKKFRTLPIKNIQNVPIMCQNILENVLNMLKKKFKKVEKIKKKFLKS